MAAPIKLIQLNIEIGKHLDVTVPFLKQEAPDIACFQEVYKHHLPVLEAAVGGRAVFEPMSIYKGNEHGVAIVTKHHIANSAVYQIGDSIEPLPVYDESTFDSKYKTSRFVALLAEVMVRDVLCKVATTHFPVTERGSVTEYQRTSMELLLAVLAKEGEFVLTGDFNAPRGGEIFSKLASVYTDNVPPQYKTSIDAKRHRNGKDRAAELADKMVDGVFSTPGYSVTNVRLQDGVSDHYAIVATVGRQ